MTSKVQKRVEKGWKARGFSCDLWIDPPNQSWEDFVHPADELLMIVQGKLELEMQGRAFYPKVEEYVFIPAKVLHSVRNIGGTTARWLYGYKKLHE